MREKDIARPAICRRNFLKTTGAVAGLTDAGASLAACAPAQQGDKLADTGKRGEDIELVRVFKGN